MELSEQEILQGFINKDSDILNYIYDEYLPPIRYHIINNSGRPSDATEVFQESMVIAYDKLRKKSFELSCSLKTYIQSISRNLWLKELRHRRRNPVYSIDAQDEINIAYEEHPETIDTDELRSYLYQKHFILLDAGCKKILRLQSKSQSFRKISKKMQYKTENQARKKRYRCMKKLLGLIMSDPEYYKLKDDED